MKAVFIITDSFEITYNRNRMSRPYCGRACIFHRPLPFLLCNNYQLFPLSHSHILGI